MWSKNDLNVYIQSELLLTKNTVSSWSLYIRTTIQIFLIGNIEMLWLDDEGNGKIVEIDESLF